VSLECGNIVMTKSNVFVGNGYYDQGFFILNAFDIINESESMSSTYIIDSYDMWHVRLRHVNSLYVIKL